MNSTTERTEVTEPGTEKAPSTNALARGHQGTGVRTTSCGQDARAPMQAQQLDFPSLQFPKDRRALYVREVAEVWRVSEKHVAELIEEGRLQAFDISGGADCAEAFAAEIARRLKTDVGTVQTALSAARAATRRTRRYWRIPIEAYNAFLKKNHSWS